MPLTLIESGSAGAATDGAVDLVQTSGLGLNIVKLSQGIDVGEAAPQLTIICEDTELTLDPKTCPVTIEALGGLTVEKDETILEIGKLIPAGTAGEANTAENVGTGVELFKEKIGAALRFRTIKGIDGIEVTQTDDEICISGGQQFEKVELASLSADTWTTVATTFSSEIRSWQVLDEDGEEIFLDERLINNCTELQLMSCNDLSNLTVLVTGI